MKVINEDFSTDNMARLEWACRRGMLELDVLLGNFLKEAYSSLSQQDKQYFVELLTYPDPELFDTLLGRAVFADANMAKMTEIIRQHARSRI